MAPASGSTTIALVVVVLLLGVASPGAHGWDWGWGTSCMETCLPKCAEASEKVEESKKLNATQCLAACNYVCPIAYLMSTGVKLEDIKPPPADEADVAAAPTAGGGSNVYVHVAFAILYTVLASY